MVFHRMRAIVIAAAAAEAASGFIRRAVPVVWVVWAVVMEAGQICDQVPLHHFMKCYPVGVGRPINHGRKFLFYFGR